jgi:hypothetical protein
LIRNITSDKNIVDKTSNSKDLKEVKSLKPFIKRELKNKYKQMCENKNLLFIVHSNIKCSSSSILLQVLQSLSILGVLQYRPFSIS